MTPREEIIDTITELFLATDRRDWDAVRDCFAPSVRFDMTSLGGGTPTTLTPLQIAEGWKSGLSPIQHVHHQAGNFKVTLRDADADAFCYGIAYHYRKTKSGKNTRLFVGSYDFHLVRDSDRWAIDSFRFNLKFIDGNPTLEQD